jgi:hypothetical protein
VLELGSMNKSLPLHSYTKKGVIYTALADNDLTEMRNISNFYYNVNGIYHRVANYLAYLYRYDWYVGPELYKDNVKEEEIMKDFSRILNFLDNSNIRLLCGQIALEVILNGAYYGYIVPSERGLSIQ